MAVWKKQKTSTSTSEPTKQESASNAADIATMLAADMDEDDSESSDEDVESEDDSSNAITEADISTENTSKRSVNKESLFRPPTNDEMRMLKDSKDLYKSNLFRLKTEEMFKEVKLNYSNQSQAEAFLHKVRDAVLAIPTASKTKDYSHGNCTIGGVKAPLPRLVKTPVSYAFATPTSVNLVGSYLLRTQAKPVLSIDIAMEMPASLFQEKDYLNYRYHAKRSLYLASTASALKKALPELKGNAIRFCEWQNDANTPVLELHPVIQSDTPATKDGKKKRHVKPLKFVVRVIPSLSPDAFLVSRLSPDRNSVRRRAVVRALGDEIEEEGNEDFEECSTPHYNACVLRDMSYNSHMTQLHDAINRTPAMVDAIILLKVWLRQRKVWSEKKSYNGSTYHEALPGINGFLLSMLLVYLLKNRKVNAKMSCYQMFKVALDFIGASDWSGSGITLASTDGTPTLEIFTKEYDVSFVDASGYYNLTAHVPLSSYLELKFEAQTSIRILDSSSDGEDFEHLFMYPADFLTRCDGFVHVRKLAPISALYPSSISHTRENVIGDRGDNKHKAVVERACEMVRKGLGDRVKLLSVRYTKYTPQSQKQNNVRVGVTTACEWGVEESSPYENADKCEGDEDQVLFTIGLRFDPANSSRSIEKGPGPDDVAGAQAFRAFWGQESTELRLFKDGAMHETVQFTATNSSNVDTISHSTSASAPYAVARHVLVRHGGGVVCEKDVIGVGPQADAFLSSTESSSGLNAEQMEIKAKSHLMLVFESLSKQLRALRELPLRVSRCVGVAPALRSTSIVVPRALSSAVDTSSDVAYYQEAMDVVLVMETSSKWPDDLEAIQHIKAAFNIKLAELLQSDQKSRAKTMRGNANPSKQMQYDALPLDVRVGGRFADVTKGGLTFRLWIKCEREEYLMATAGESTAVNAYHTQYELRPIHAKAISDLSSVYKSYSPAVRLFKRWVNSHLLSNVFTDEALEIIVAAAFLQEYNPKQDQSENANVPHSTMAGFLRALELVATHDWTNEILFVSGLTNGIANPELTVAQRQEAQHILSTAVAKGFRASIPPAFLVTSLDAIVRIDPKTGGTAANVKGMYQWTSPWTSKDKLAAVLFPRFIALAKATVQTLRTQLLVLSDGGTEHQKGEQWVLTQFSTVFQPVLSEYDALITMTPSSITRSGEALQEIASTSTPNQVVRRKSGKRKYKNLEPIQSSDISEVATSALLTNVVVGFDPVTLFVNELRREFGHIALFLYNANGGNTVGVVWADASCCPMKFSVMKCRFTCPVDIKTVKGKDPTASTVRVDPQYVLDEAKRLGNGLVDKVIVNRLP